MIEMLAIGKANVVGNGDEHAWQIGKLRALATQAAKSGKNG
jgi:hypothetical protein